MTPRGVGVLTGVMGDRFARKAFVAYRRDVLGPVARRVEALPDGDDAPDDAEALRALRDSLDASVLSEMSTAGLAESLTEAGVQASLIGRAASPEVRIEK